MQMGSGKDTWNSSMGTTGSVRCVYETVDNITINQQYYDCSYEI